jgi:predicted small lipoprotein YifL
MKLKPVVFLLMILVCLGGSVGCGKKGPPKPPSDTSLY